jgi:ABC-type branched-subunit amino acid transport system substrate-binding protein
VRRPETGRSIIGHARLRIVAAATLLAFAIALGAPPSAPAQSGPIKIGLLAPLTGAFAAIGKDMLNGTELYLDEIGRQAGGRKIELIVEDTEDNTATALTKARKLVDQDKIPVLATFPAVSQFWKYNPEEYLKLPLYTRDYPACKAC